MISYWQFHNILDKKYSTCTCRVNNYVDTIPALVPNTASVNEENNSPDGHYDVPRQNQSLNEIYEQYDVPRKTLSQELINDTSDESMRQPPPEPDYAKIRFTHSLPGMLNDVSTPPGYAIPIKRPTLKQPIKEVATSEK